MTLRLALALSLAALLAGCKPLKPAPLEDTLMVRGDENSVEVTARYDGLDPYPAAVGYCQARGLIARYRSVNNRRTTFDCVAPAR